MLESLWQDVRHAARSLRRTPGFTAAAVITLAIGIGANTAIFSLLDGVMFKALDVAEAGELLLLRNASGPDLQFGLGPDARFSYPAFQRFSRALPDGTALAAMSRIALMNVRPGTRGQAVHAGTQLVSGAYFSIFQARALRGRLIVNADNLQIDSHPVAVVSYAFWQHRLGASPSAVGSDILVNSVPFTVIGVAEQAFEGVWLDGATDIWIPVSMQHAVNYRQNFRASAGRTNEPWLPRDDISWLTLVARAPDARTPALRAALEVEHRRVLTALVEARGVNSDQREAFLAANSLRLVSFARGLSTLRARFGTPLYVLMAMVVLVLLIACVNIANLLLAKGIARAREIGVRMALGASRLRLLRQLIVEEDAAIRSRLRSRLRLGRVDQSGAHQTRVSRTVCARCAGFRILPRRRRPYIAGLWSRSRTARNENRPGAGRRLRLEGVVPDIIPCADEAAADGAGGARGRTERGCGTFWANAIEFRSNRPRIRARIPGKRVVQPDRQRLHPG